MARTACSYYLGGVVEGAGELQLATGARHICIPSGVTAQRANDVVKAYLDSHPDERSQSAAALTIAALAAEFPCPSSE